MNKHQGGNQRSLSVLSRDRQDRLASFPAKDDLTADLFRNAVGVNVIDEIALPLAQLELLSGAKAGRDSKRLNEADYTLRP
jgi:hypothetical protein